MSERESQPGHEALWLVLVLILATALRLWGLGSWDWEGDELYTLRDARDLGAYAVSTGAPGITARPVYYLLQHALLQVLPPTHFFLRLPAFFFGVAGVGVTWWLGRRMFGGYAGLFAALLAALSPWHLYASQFARYWTLVYLLAAAAFGWLVIATETDRRQAYLRALLLLVLGTLTHPTFAFPMAGAVAALHVVSGDGQVRLSRPSRSALLFLWLPLALAATIGAIALNVLGRQGAIENQSARGTVASLRLIPAMVQWMAPPIAAASAGACAYLFLAGGRAERRWAVMTVLGASGAFLLLFIASFQTGVYSDYGIAVLPLLFVAIGGAVNRVAEQIQDGSAPIFVMAAAAALALTAAPETLSHLSDGSRFDYRPAFAVVRQLGPQYPIAGLIDDIQAADAPDLQRISLVDARAAPDSSFWLIVSTRRWGLREGGARFQAWIDWSCRRVQSRERPRFDYRQYRVDLYWCGPAPVPGGKS